MPLLTALIGGDITIPTIDGDVELVVPQGTQPGDRKALKKRGMPRLARSSDGPGRGDQWITLKVDIPTTLTSQQKSLLREAFGPKRKAEKESPKKKEEVVGEETTKKKGGFVNFLRELTKESKD